uniref:dihydrouracil dehydrogenase (NAD(+)) n=1 Tax=Fervidobacterium pennivorans TaxID=93466 RepID=A0A7V4KEE0_FERPE
MNEIDLSIEFLGFRLRNPLIAAPGPLTRDYCSIAKIANAGIGAVITKTILLKPSVNPSPCLYRGHGFFLNTERCSTLSLDKWLTQELPKAAALSIPIIASIGMTPEEVAKLAKPIVAAGANMLELSIFTPYDDPTPMVKAVQMVKEKVDVPILVKLSCNVHDPVEFGEAVKEAGADALSAIDALKAGMNVDLRTGRPVLLEQGFGRISGEAIKPLALYHVAQLAYYVGLPIIGTGGVFSARDVIDMFYCGASAVGICTALIVYGPDIIKNILQDLRNMLYKLKISSLQDIKGKTLKWIDFPSNIEERREYEKRAWVGKQLTANIDIKLCTFCGRCKKICPYQAVDNYGNKFLVLKEKCQGCGLCVSLCPANAVTLENCDGML